MGSYLLPPIGPNGTLRAVPLSTGGLVARPGARKAKNSDGSDVLPNRGPVLTKDLCPRLFVMVGSEKIQVRRMSVDHVKRFLHETLEKMYPDNQKAIVEKYRYLTNVGGLWDDYAKWWMLSELERFAKDKLWQGKPIELFVANGENVE